MTVRKRCWKDPSGSTKEGWLIDIVHTHPDGRKERIKRLSPVNTRRGAEEFERQVRQSLLDGSFGKEHVETPTFAEFKETFLDYARNHNKPSQLYAKTLVLKNHLLPAFGRMRLDRIRMPEVESYKAKKLKEELSPKTVNNHLTMLRKALNLAHEMEIISSVPKIRALRVTKSSFEFLTFEEADRFLAAARPEWKCFLTVALNTGLRSGELLALKWEDIDLKAGRLIVRRSVWNGIEDTPKNGRTREVPLNDTAIASLKSHRHLNAYVFCDPTGARRTHSELKKLVPLTCKLAGLPKRLTTHHLRHTFASHLVMKGVPLAAVRDLLGHADITTTMIYAHLSPNVTRDAVRMLDSTGQASRPHGPYEAHGS